MSKVIWTEASELAKPRTALERAWMRHRIALNALRSELVAVLEVAIARGEALGYADDDYRQRLVALQDKTPMPTGKDET